MLAALSFASVLAISMASYVAISYNTLERADERVEKASKILAGENLLEETLYSVSSNNLADWSLSGGSATRTVTGLDLGLLADALPINFTQTLSIEEADEDEAINPDAVELTLTGLNPGSFQRTLSMTQRSLLNDGSVEVRTLEATMSPLPPFRAAIAAKNTIRLRREGTIDSYDSSRGDYGKNNNRGYEAVLSGNYVSVSRAQVAGYVAGANRTPYFGRRAELKGPDTSNRVDVDTSRIIPTPYTPNLDAREASGVGSLYSGPNSTLGSSHSSEPRIYYASEIDLSGNEQITINGPTRLVVEGNINLRDNAAIVVRNDASLEIHVDGNINLDGKGIINLSKIPANVAIIGTNLTSRSITFRGDEPLHGAIFAPNSDFYAYGNRTERDLFGAIVAKSVTFDDPTNFHFDVALREAHFDGVEKAYAFDPGQ